MNGPRVLPRRKLATDKTLEAGRKALRGEQQVTKKIREIMYQKRIRRKQAVGDTCVSEWKRGLTTMKNLM